MDITAGEVTFARGYIDIVKLVFRRDKQSSARWLGGRWSVLFVDFDGIACGEASACFDVRHVGFVL